MRILSTRAGLACVAASLGLFVCLAADDSPTTPALARWKQHDITRPRPPVVEPAEAGPIATPPKDAVVLFGGTDLDAWKSSSGGPIRWRVIDGAMETVPGAGMVQTKGTFGDIQLHVEWAAPAEPRARGRIAATAASS